MFGSVDAGEPACDRAAAGGGEKLRNSCNCIALTEIHMAGAQHA
jgi:hypothetical protein